MNRFHIIVIIILGIFLVPDNAVACEKKSITTEKSCCKKESTSKSEKKSCCDKKDNSGKECGGKCGHSKCGCPSSIITVLNFYGEIHINNSIDFISEKQKFYNSETFISSGFYSLWLIPKIS
ncbi:hypothetical protein [Flavobacterium sp. GT3R68]|uniref:hypothetical protein n=1 Tax=Flavobacterium sp. GT3R68 TaxID=2594437 RepID=UPI000F883F9D|nr:hypothetical protein [Flavobacterium sp. GT3R68]RTY89852.1 hypothetical protein EKL32_22120 [Flavobacterium sp. GSN2]TRW89831.1 hypothetical protein FNW07_12350 [Flavobacterium sp. GT3R68]